MYDRPLNFFILKSLPAFNLDYKMRLKECDLNEIIKELAETLPAHLNKGIEVRMEPSGRELKIMADPLRLKEAFLNLAKKSGEAMSSGGTLTFSSKLAPFKGTSMNIGNDCPSGISALFSVSDTGVGMDEKTQEKLYEPFFTTKEGVGRGLGFPVASYIIQSHHGSISVDSALGLGTTINVYFPLIREDILRPSPIPLPPSFANQAGDGQGDTF